MDRATELISLLWIPALPLGAALLGRVLLRQLRGRPDRGAALTLQMSLGGVLLAALLSTSAIAALLDQGVLRIPDTVGTWLEIGTTTTLRFDLVLDPLAAAVMACLVILAIAAQIAAALRPRQHLAITAIVGAALLLLLGQSLLIIALGWHLLGALALLSGPRPSRAHLRRLALGDGALWLSILALPLAAGSPDIPQVLRSTLQGPASRLLTLDLATIPVALAATLALVGAVLSRSLGSPPQPQTPRRLRQSTLFGVSITTLIAVYLLLRLGAVLAIDAGTLLSLVVAGSGLVVVGAARATAAPSRRGALAALHHVHLGWVLVALGVRAWAPALVVAMIAAAAQLGLTMTADAAGSAGENPRQRRGEGLGATLCSLAATTATPLGMSPALCLIGAAAWGLGGGFKLVPALLIGTAAALAYALARPREDGEGRTPATTPTTPRDPAQAPRAAVLTDADPREEGQLLAISTGILGILALALGGLCLPALLAGLGLTVSLPLDAFETLIRSTMRAAEVLAPSPTLIPSAIAWIAALLFGAGAAATALGRRARPKPAPTGGARRSATLLPGLQQALAAVAAPVSVLFRLPGSLLRWIEELLGEARRRLFLRLWLADAGPRPRVVLALLTGISLTLGVIYCNPQISVIGPTAVHPVDLGGINPLISAPKRDPKRDPKQTLQRALQPEAPPVPVDPVGPVGPEIPEDYR